MKEKWTARGSLLCLMSAALASVTFHASSRAQLDSSSFVVSYCFNYRNSIKLNDDRTVLCFDGPIKADRDNSAFLALKQNGLFVMRSGGGYAPTAIELSDILREKNAKIIMYDYCLSACANYFLIASSETYVLKGTVVAWHSSFPKIDCSSAGMERLQQDYNEYLRSRQIADTDLSPEQICKHSELSKAFFVKRGIDDRHIYAPQTAYTRKVVDLAIRETMDKRKAFWMWNPQNYGDYFKSQITYESYPGSQDAVDEIVMRLMSIKNKTIGTIRKSIRRKVL